MCWGAARALMQRCNLWAIALRLSCVCKGRAPPPTESAVCCLRMAKTKSTDKKTKQAPPRGKKKPRAQSSSLRGRAARLGFLLDVAAAAKISVGDVRKALDGMRVTVARNLRETSSCRIPRLVHLRVRILPARDSFTKTISGKTCVWKARQHATKKILGAPLKTLTDAMS